MPISFPNPLGPSGTNTISDLLIKLIYWLEVIVAPIAVIMIIYAGVMFIFSKGDPQKVTTAKKILLYAVIGLAVILINVGFKGLIDSILSLGQ